MQKLDKIQEVKDATRLKTDVNKMFEGDMDIRDFTKARSQLNAVGVTNLSGEVGVNELYLLESDTLLQKIKDQLKLISFEDVSIDPEGYRPGKINVITN